MSHSVCGGPSEPQPGYAGSVQFVGGALAALVEDIGMPWAIPYLGALGVVDYDLSTLCNQDPPPMPTFVPQDFIDLLRVTDLPAQIAATAKLSNAIGNALWYKFCQCSSGTTPDGPPPPQPIGVPNVGSPGQLPCFSGAASTSGPWQPFGSTSVQVVDIGPQLFRGPVVGSYQVLTDPQSVAMVALPSSMSVTAFGFVTHFDANPFPKTVHWQVVGHTLSGSHIAFASGDMGGVTSVDTVTDQAQTNAVSGTIVSASAWVQPGSHTNLPSGTFSITGNFTCSGQTLGSPCANCPPDPTLSAYLAQILQMVTLMQRQVVPFSSIHGATHTALSGAGNFTVQGILGVAVSLDAVPPYIGEELGNPDTLFDVGWINLGTADGWLPRERITADPFLMLPSSLGGMITRVGYTFNPGIVATITEIVREA